jgi:hypothetical protein
MELRASAAADQPTEKASEKSQEFVVIEEKKRVCHLKGWLRRFAAAALFAGFLALLLLLATLILSI